MSAISVQIADAVVDHVNDGTYSWNFNARRLSFPAASIQDADGLLVTVFMGPRVSEQFTRGAYQRTHTTYLVFQRKLPADSTESTTETDSLAELVERVEEGLEGEEMAGYVMTGFTEDVERVPFNVEILRDTGTFVAVVAMEYQG